MREVHRTWVIETHDTGFLPEAEMHLRSHGRSPYTMARDADKFPQQRIFEAADLVGRGPATVSKLTARLSDPDSAVRYWAVVGLTALDQEAQPATEPLMRALGDPAPNVRLAAAEILCKLGRQHDAVPVIVEGLEHENGWVRLHAAIVAVAVGQKAQAAVPQIKAAINDQRQHQATLYIRWALTHALAALGSPQE